MWIISRAARNDLALFNLLEYLQIDIPAPSRSSASVKASFEKREPLIKVGISQETSMRMTASIDHCRIENGQRISNHEGSLLRVGGSRNDSLGLLRHWQRFRIAHPHDGRGGNAVRSRAFGDQPSRRYSILARPPHRRDVAFTGNAERREMRPDRIGDIGCREVGIVFFGHAGIGMA